MDQIILGTIIAFLASAGVILLWQNLQRFFLMPPQDRVTMLVTASGHDENLEYLVRSLFFKSRSLRSKESPVIIIVDQGMDGETKAICCKLMQEYDFLQVCRPEELETLLQSGGNLTTGGNGV